MAVDPDREAADGGDVSAGPRVIDLGCKAVGEVNVFTGPRVVNVGHKVVEGDVGFAGARVIDVGRKTVEEGEVFADTVTSSSLPLLWMVVSWTGCGRAYGTLTSSGSAATSNPLVSCPSAPPTSALSLESPGSFASLM